MAGALFHRDPEYDYPVATHGEGIYLYDESGRRLIDGISGAGNVTLGHGRRDIAAVLAEQAGKLAYCFSAFLTNQPAIDLAERVAAAAPGDLRHVYFASGGSEAIESAFKLARQHHLQRGNGQKQLIISRWRSYHGATMGALAATGIPSMRAPFEPWLADFPHIEACYPYRCAVPGCDGACNLGCARHLEEEIRRVGAENVAAFVAEPVVMAGIAVGVPPPEYFAEIRAICDRHDVLFIADEIITGFGRTGRLFAIEHWGVTPDLLVFGKGASSGYAPLGGVVMRGHIADGFAQSKDFFQHVFTYVNNPLSTRVGLQVLDVLEAENVVAHVAEVGEYALLRARTLLRHAIVGDVRGKGLLLGIELVEDRQTKAPLPAAAQASKRLCRLCLERGLSLSGGSGCVDWVQGDDIRFYPPLIITREQIDEAIAIIDASLTQLQQELA